MATAVDAVTLRVDTTKFALVAPAATVTFAGTVATLVLPLDKTTTTPPLVAALLSVTVPWEELPPVTLVGFSATEDKLAGVGGGGTGRTVRTAVRVVPPNAAE